MALKSCWQIPAGFPITAIVSGHGNGVATSDEEGIPQESRRLRKLVIFATSLWCSTRLLYVLTFALPPREERLYGLSILPHPPDAV